jgi:hypothetical protein
VRATRSGKTDHEGSPPALYQTWFLSTPRGEIPRRARTSSADIQVPALFGLYRNDQAFKCTWPGMVVASRRSPLRRDARLERLGTWRSEKPYTSQTRSLISTWAHGWIEELTCFLLGLGYTTLYHASSTPSLNLNLGVVLGEKRRLTSPLRSHNPCATRRER